MPKSMIEKMEEAAGIESTPVTPKKATPPPSKGFIAPPHTGPRPWAEKGKAENPSDKGDGSAREL